MFASRRVLAASSKLRSARTRASGCATRPRVPSECRSMSAATAAAALPAGPAQRAPSPLGATKVKVRFDPNSILPSGFGQVRVIGNTVRDGQQSNLSAEMADEHRQQVGAMIDDVYKNMKGPRGYEQIWGGTIPMFDIWKRGVQPFTSLQQMKGNLPNTPTSALIRSNGLNALGVQPRDVVDAFIRLTAASGIDVFTNFDAHNDWRNHKNVAEAVLKYNMHYQAAVSWAVHRLDPTIYNVQWVIDFFAECVKMGAHSLYVKDPSGVLTPEMAGVLAAQIKEAFPDKPLVFHTHYQTGFGYMSYLEAVKNGANGVECSVGLCDGAAQPYALSMLRTFEEFGYDTGNPSKEAMQKIADASKEIQAMYAQGRAVRLPDIRVEVNGIAGGQRTILDKELLDAGQPHLIAKIDDAVAVVRDEGGKVCQVTPAADQYAREAMRRLRGGDPNSNFTPGYASILAGEGGLVKEPVDEVKQKRALWERGAAAVEQLAKDGVIPKEIRSTLIEHGVLTAIRDVMFQLATPVKRRARLGEVTARISQLKRIAAKKDLLASLNRKIALAQATDSNGKPIRTVQDRLALLEQEVAQIQSDIKAASDTASSITDQEYEQILHRKPSRKWLEFVLNSSPDIKSLVASGVKEETLAQLLSASALITCIPSDIVPPGLAKAEAVVRQVESDQLLGLTDSPTEFEELVVLQAMYAKAAIPNLMLNFFKNYKTDRSFWPLLYTPPAAGKTAKKSPEKIVAAPFLLGNHSTVKHIVGDHAIDELVAAKQRIAELSARLQIASIGAPTKEYLKQLIGLSEETIKKTTQQATALLEKAIRAQPGLVTGRLPSFDAAGRAVLVPPPVETELAQASKLLNELVASHMQA